MVTNFPQRRVDTGQVFKYLWIFRQLHGFFPELQLNWLQNIYYLFVVIMGNFLLVSTFAIQLFYVDNLKQLLNNLPMNITLIACALKFFTFLSMHRELLDIQDYFAELDRKVRTEKHVKFMGSLVTFCQRGLLIIFVAFELVVTSAALNAAVSHREALLFDVWTPYDFHDPPWVYWATFMFQYFLMSIAAVQNLTNDMSAPVYFILLNGHLEVILERIGEIGWDPKKKPDENYTDLVNCIEDHQFVLKIFNIMQRAVSQTIFLQYASTALALSMEALLFLMYPPNLTEAVLLLFFFSDSTLEILPCSYYANKFMSITDRVVTAVYSCNFPDQSPKFKKVIIIFMQMTQKPKVVMAGKIIPVTLSTFASIIKLSYSLLALANKLR